MARGITGKTKTRIENLIAWSFAALFIVFLAAGVFYIGLQLGIV